MTRILTSLAEISADYDVLLCDLWGCLHNGRTPFPAAVAALQGFRAQGGAVVLLTNSPRPRPAVIRQLDQLGVPTDCYDEVVSSGDAAQAALVAGAVGRKVWHIGPERDIAFFTEMAEDLTADMSGAETIARVDLKDAEGIVCTGPVDDRTDRPEDYRARFLTAKTMGLKMLCANPDIVVDLGETRIYCAGALAQYYEGMGGEALYFGKPHPPIYDLARRRLAALGRETSSDRILAVGDGIMTDVQGAQSEGIDAIFITGGLAFDQFGPDVETPDTALLSPWLEDRQLAPPYAMGRLR